MYISKHHSPVNECLFNVTDTVIIAPHVQVPFIFQLVVLGGFCFKQTTNSLFLVEKFFGYYILITYPLQLFHAHPTWHPPLFFSYKKWPDLQLRTVSGSMDLLQSGTVLMYVAPVIIQGLTDARVPCLYLRAMLLLGPYQFEWPGLPSEAMVTSRSKWLLRNHLMILL